MRAALAILVLAAAAATATPPPRTTNLQLGGSNCAGTTTNCG